MKILLVLSVMATSLSVGGSALARDCGCRARHVRTHYAVPRVSRGIVRRVVFVREPVVIRERVVVREPVYVRQPVFVSEPPIVVQHRLWRPVPYPLQAWVGDQRYARAFHSVRVGYEGNDGNERGAWQPGFNRGRDGWRDHDQREGGWRDEDHESRWR